MLTDSAKNDWQRARRKVIYQNVVCAITHCSVDMRSFEEVRNRLHLTQSHYLGLQEIDLDRIRGSVGRYDDFTATFMPRKDHMRDRWKQVYQLVKQGKEPPIEVYQVDEAYFVVDGNHRVSAARQQGRKTIRASVIAFDKPAGFDFENVDEFLIESEQATFLEKVSDADTKDASEIKFTCVGCYADLTGQVETYREGMEIKNGKPVSFDQAFSAWHDEVYTPAVQAIQQDDLLNLFPNRTEADLFIWSWQNSGELEAEELE